MIVKDLSSLLKEIKLVRKGKRVGLITGCFDIIHPDHLELFKFAKENVDILIIGLDEDKTIKLNKVVNRPYFKYSHRALVLNSLIFIDYIFPLNGILKYESKRTERIHIDVLKQINPDFVISNSKTDKYFNKRKNRSNKLGIKILDNNRERKFSSTKIINKIISFYFFIVNTNPRCLFIINLVWANIAGTLDKRNEKIGNITQ